MINQHAIFNNSSQTVCINSENKTVDIKSIMKSKASSHVMKSLNDLRQYGEFCDLILEVKSTKFFVHRLVVAAWSPPLKNLLHCDLACIQHVQISYDKPEVFRQFIAFMYTGVLAAEYMNNIPAVLLLASTFQIQLLIELCAEQLKLSTTVDNVIRVHQLAIKFSLPDLELHCVDFLRQHLAEVAPKQELRELSATQINYFLGSEYVLKLDPEMKLFLIISWLTEDVSTRQQFLVLLLGHIDWTVVAKDFLEEISRTENFFTSNPSSLYLLLQTLHSSSISLGPYSEQFQSLREKYSYLLGSVVSSSVELGTRQPKSIQTIHFSLLPCSADEQQGVVDQKRSSYLRSKCVQETFKHEVSQVVNNEEELPDHNIANSIDIFDTESPDQHTLLSNSQHTIVLTDSGAMDSNSEMTETQLLEHEGSSLSNISGTSEKNMRRKSLRPRKIVTEPVEIVAKVMKVSNKSTSYKKNAKLGCLNVGNGDKSIKTKQTPETAKSKREENRKRKIKINMPRPHRTRQRIKIDENYKKVKVQRNEEEQTNNKKTDLLSTEFIKEEAISEEEQRSGRSETKQITDQKKKKTDKNKPGGNAQSKESTSQSGISKKGVIRDGKMVLSSVKKSGHPNQKQGKKKGKLDFKLQAQKCSQCDVICCGHTEMEKHLEQVHGNTGNCLFCCSLCSFKSKLNKEYYEHMRKNHFPGPPFQCDDEECSYSTDKFQLLMSHRKLHGDQRPFVCDICLMAFRSKNNLYAHFKIHSDEKKFECPVCHRSFKLKNTLDQHMVIHSDLRPYLCDLCGFSTKFQSHLISHKRTHSGEVYKCTFPSCSYSTPKRSQLKSHMRSHLGIRRHVCSTCGKAFVEKSHLIRHERIHSAERAYACVQCQYSSTRADKLREHIQKHHSEMAQKTKSAAVSKKENTAGKGKMKKISKDTASKGTNKELLGSNQDSLIEVVVVKDGSLNIRPQDAVTDHTAMSHETTLSDISFPLTDSQGETAIRMISLPVGPASQLGSSDKFSELTKNEKEMSTVEILARMGLPVNDNVGEAVFSQLSEKTGGRQTLIVPSTNKSASAVQVIQHQQQAILHPNLTTPSYAIVMAPHSSTEMNPLQMGPHLSLVSGGGDSHPLMMGSSVRSSDMIHHYYAQQQGTQHHHHQQQQQQSQQHFSAPEEPQLTGQSSSCW